MEQLARQDFVLGAGSGLPKGNLKGRSARVIVTMGMPAPFYRFYYRAHGVKAFNRSILGIGGIGPIATTYLGGIGAPRSNCARALHAMRQLGGRGV